MYRRHSLSQLACCAGSTTSHFPSKQSLATTTAFLLYGYEPPDTRVSAHSLALDTRALQSVHPATHSLKITPAIRLRNAAPQPTPVPRAQAATSLLCR